jgi:HD-GYP domain-containing protein (c-di-GMP phosphodiesterase class II)
VYFAALLHDVGKIGIRADIINKVGELTDEEYEQIKRHTTLGDQILSSIKQSPSLRVGAHYHHERYDGTGYPDRLSGEDIPEVARIIAVADAYDAMTSGRSYRDALPEQMVRDELSEGMGRQFDPRFAEILLRILDRGGE